MSAREPLVAAAPAAPRRRCPAARSTAGCPRPGPRRPRRTASSRSSRPRRGSGARGGAGSGTGRRRCTRATPPFMVTASGWAPPMPPRPAVRVRVAGQRAAEPFGRPPRRTSRRCPAGCPACRCRSTNRRSSGRTWSARAPRGGGTPPSWPTPGPAGSWRSGPGGPIRGCGRRRPACPTGPAASRHRPRSRSDRDDGVERGPAAGGPAGAAVDDELVGTLGHLGIEVVHQHPQGGLLRPALTAEVGAARGADRPGARSRPGGVIAHGQ